VTESTTTKAGEEMASFLVDAGFSGIHVETLAIKPAVVCVLATSAAA
jgi:hypothetical protein